MDSGTPSIEAAREKARRIAAALVRDASAADDIAQEAALRIVQGRFKPKRSFPGALAAMVRHIVSNEHRGAGRRKAREERAQPGGNSPSTAQLLAQAEAQEQLWSHVRALGEPNRTVILLRYVEGLPPRQIANRLDLPLETVKSRLKRGLAMLRERMDTSHGDRRDRWMALLFPLAMPRGVVEHAAAMGGTLMQANAMKRAAVIVTAALAVGGVAWGVVAMQASRDTPSSRTTLQGKTIDASDAAPGLATAPETEDGADMPGGESPAEDTVVFDEPPAETDPFRVPPILHESPFGLAKRRGGGRKVKNANGDWVEVDGYAGGGMTGHRTAFPVGVMPKGDATLVVKVVDSDGEPVKSARVLLGPTKLAGVKPISYGDMKRFEQATDGEGLFTIERLPAGSVAVGADFNNNLAQRGGYDGSYMVPHTLTSHAKTRVTVKLPFSVAKSGRVRGRITLAGGKPIAGGQAFIRNNHKWIRDGVFVLEGVPAGEHTLKVRVWEHEPIDQTVTVRPGETTEVAFTMEPKEGGDLSLRGTVVGPEGEPVARAYVYLSTDRSTLRTVRTDASGRFVMADLPDRVKSGRYRLQGSGFPKFGSATLTFEEGVDRAEVRLVLRPRFIDLYLDLRDLSTDEPVVYADIEAKVEGEKHAPGFHRGKDGRFKAMIAAGRRAEITVRGLDHKDQTFVLDVPSGKDEHTHVVKMRRTSPDSVEVALNFTIKDADTDQGITRVKITILDRAGGEMISAFEGSRDGGQVRMPGYSGQRHLRVEAEGYETHTRAFAISPAEPEVRVVIALRPK